MAETLCEECTSCSTTCFVQPLAGVAQHLVRDELVIRRPTGTALLQPSSPKQTPQYSLCCGTRDQEATTLLLQPLPSWPQLPKSNPHTRVPTAWVLGPTSTFPCSQGFLPSAAHVGTKEGDLRLAPACWIHRTAASGPPSTTLSHCLVPRDEPASCTQPRLDGACKPRGTWIIFFFSGGERK